MIPSSSSGLFFREDNHAFSSRRGDIHSDTFGGPASSRRRIFVGEDGLPVRDDDPASEATFSNLDPGTSEADLLGGDSTRTIWGTNISITDSMTSYKNFLLGFSKKHRYWFDGMTTDETAALGPIAEEKEYVTMINNMRHLGIGTFNLDLRNLRAYPSTKKLAEQLLSYPQEIVPIMDQACKDIAVHLANEEMRNLQRTAGDRARDGSSIPPAPSSEANTPGPSTANAVPDPVAEAETTVYKTLPFGLDKVINMRDLDPNDIDKLISIKGLVIRTTPVIPDMKEAFFKCAVCGSTDWAPLDRGKIKEPTLCKRKQCGSKNSMEIVHNRSVFADKQVIKLQETPDAVPDGQTPHSVSLCVYDEMVDVCKAGDRIEVTGVFRSNPVRVNPRMRTVKNLFKTYVDVVHIKKADKRRMGNDASTVEQELAEHVAGQTEQIRKVSREEEEKIRVTSQREDIYDLLSRSLAPSIYEMDDVKKGILLQLFGGTNKSFEKGGSPKYRGDINILLCGDPSTSKSQVLQYVHKIAPPRCLHIWQRQFCCWFDSLRYKRSGEQATCT